MSLRLRLTLFYSLFIAIILTAVAIAVYYLTERSLKESLEDRGLQALVDLSEGNVAAGLLRLPGDTYYEIVVYPFFPVSAAGDDLRDGVRYSVNPSSRGNPTTDDLPDLMSTGALDVLLRDSRVTTEVTLASGKNLLVLGTRGEVKLPIYARTYPATILIGIPANGVTETLSQLRSTLIRIVLAAFALFALGVWLLSNRVLSPVNRVTRAAAQVTGLDLSQRVPVPGTKDEIQDLAVTLNNMLDRLQESFETQRRFTADASHELRTPVTAIVGHANYLLRRTKPSPEQVDSLTVIRREAERMAKLVNDLLELARADAGFAIQREPMNLVEVLEAVHMEVVPVAGSTDIRVQVADPLIEVLGDAARLKQVVLNLVQNALNAGSKTITISAIKEKKNVHLQILDDGPGIPAEAIPHLFDRFYRVDGARSTRGNGSGLGLAIVNWIVQQHGGTVEVESRLGEGTVFTVLLPALNPKMTETAFLTQTRTIIKAPPKTA